jgi:hypothetical protein
MDKFDAHDAVLDPALTSTLSKICENSCSHLSLPSVPMKENAGVMTSLVSLMRVMTEKIVLEPLLASKVAQLFVDLHKKLPPNLRAFVSGAARRMLDLLRMATEDVATLTSDVRQRLTQLSLRLGRLSLVAVTKIWMPILSRFALEEVPLIL